MKTVSIKHPDGVADQICSMDIDARIRRPPTIDSKSSLSGSSIDQATDAFAQSLLQSNVAQATTDNTSASSGYLFSPTIDLLFIANLYWPILLLVDSFGNAQSHESMLFWQVFFVTAPHRWITLVLVTCDRERTANRKATFISFAVAILAVCLCLRLGTGSLLCLGAIDYVWNAWHFSSQHHGVFRIYERQGRSVLAGGSSKVEKLLFRFFLLYVIARVAGWGWTEGPFAGSESVSRIDLYLLVIPVFFVARQLWRVACGHRRLIPSAIYLASVMALFSAMLLVSHWEKGQWVLRLALASAVFHSLEYLSVVTWSVQSTTHPKHRESQGRIFGYLARMWLAFLLVFMVAIGIGNYFLSRGYFDVWVLINIVVAFWHYCFDGMIWKARAKSPVATVVAPGGG